MKFDDPRLVEQWSPPWAPHVAGRFEARSPGEPRRIVARCSTCGDETPMTCDSGNVRQRVAIYARVHLHRDPLKVIR